MNFLGYISKSYHRNLLEKLLNKYKYLIKGKILDIGSKNRRYDHLFQGRIIAADINPSSELNIIKANIIDLQFQSNYFDAIICLEVFQYLDPDTFKKGFEEIYRVLKKDGNALISIPFYFWDHRDNMRVTFNYITNYLKQFNKLKFKIIKIGNKYTSLYDIIRYSRDFSKPNRLRDLAINFILLIIYLIIKVFSLENKQDSFYSGFFIIWSKKW